jgi:hypothetical protein
MIAAKALGRENISRGFSASKTPREQMGIFL